MVSLSVGSTGHMDRVRVRRGGRIRLSAASLLYFLERRTREVRRIPLPRNRVNRAKDGEEVLPLTWSSVAAGKALVVVSPIIVIDSYAIPDNVLTAAFLVTYHWP
jgi:hypothetical protein